ncbi:MAG: hypothetical protein UX28_C0003G0158 [Candidatus Pacebacteria bacterium GW2011_GWA1_46_10]|nr:MAG: hypothetical protein UX28_C0003G0158 [Candidatus Pacebacteria bacterium GW2011_GWA1_46_10]HCR81604.1 hypothetical protein [Candidatus Paceibacterota bacterium]
MQKDPEIYINDILFSIDLIEQYIDGLSFSQFENSFEEQDKILRRLEIIAEAAKKLPEDIRAQNDSIPWKSIIGLRNIITHEYDEVNLEEIWTIVSEHLPETKKQIEAMKSGLSQLT